MHRGPDAVQSEVGAGVHPLLRYHPFFDPHGHEGDADEPEEAVETKEESSTMQIPSSPAHGAAGAGRGVRRRRA